MEDKLKEILYKQLELLAEESKKNYTADDLAILSDSMCTIAELLKSDKAIINNNTFTLKEEADIEKIAEKLYQLQFSATRSSLNNL